MAQSSEAAVGTSDALGKLPYGREFLFVDEIVSVSVPREIVTRFRFSAANPLIRAHFKHGPKLVPGVLIAEQLCQSVLLLGMLAVPEHQSYEFVVGKLNCDFLAPIPAPAVVESHVTIQVSTPTAYGFWGKVFVRGHHVATIRGAVGRLKDSAASHDSVPPTN
jgi:3-hydroxymyristoyl/3-hydroxydecanoyl-(acyl carrier protein) dehydratase